MLSVYGIIAVWRWSMVFSLFKSKEKKELDGIIAELNNYLQNNYKDPAHDMRRLLKERADALYAEGRIDDDTYKKYISIYESYTEMMKNYRH